MINLMKIVGLLTLVGGCSLGLYPLGYWMAHPDLTQMQVFIENWWITFVALGLMFAGVWIIGDNR